MDSSQAELVHRVLTLARKIEGHEQAAMLSIGESFLSLKQSEAWKGYYPEAGKSWRKFLVASGFKPQTIENAMRVTARFGKIITNNDLQVVPTRLVALLTIKPSSNDALYVEEMASRDVPHFHFKDALDSLKGKAEKPICDHINLPEGIHNKRLQWTQHTCCGSWELLS